MRDMEAMELEKPGYIETRRIKAYILGVKLKTFGMHSEFAELEKAFQEAFQRTDFDNKSQKKGRMLSHADVLQMLSNELVLSHEHVSEMISEEI